MFGVYVIRLYKVCSQPSQEVHSGPWEEELGTFLEFSFFFYSGDNFWWLEIMVTNKEPICRRENKDLQVGWRQTASLAWRVHEGSLLHPKGGKAVPPWGLVGGCVGHPFSAGNNMEWECKCCTDTLKGQHLIDEGGGSWATIWQVNASWKAFFGKWPPDSI